MPTTAQHWQRVKEIFEAAADLGPSERAVLLAKSCEQDTALRHEVESLLQSDAAADGFIESPIGEVPRDLLDRNGEAEFAIGRQFGAYKILREIGRGGLGSVYLAARADEQYEKQVAIKLVRRGLDTEDILHRFRNERQILAQLDHPNIARLIDGGTTDEGLPYFMMEYVEGESILDYCQRRNLVTRERLQLFRKVCAAVTYAHQNLVIHRDLKPSNILVRPDGEPKLLDFGIAKVLSAETNESFTLTMPALRVMTPEYSSPEQISGGNITTTSDVYSLGVLLFELLTGERPYRLDRRTPDAIAHAVTAQEPRPPSTAVQHGKPEVTNLKSLRGDLDNIVLMAMRKEPARRYPSVAQLSEDIRRHLEGLPVIARQDTVAYRTAKFFRRNRVGVVAAALVLFALIVGIVCTTWEAGRAREQAWIAAQQRDRAEKQAAKAERVTTFLQNVLGFSDPSWASSNPNRKRDATIYEALIEAQRRAEKELANEPEALAAVLFTIGNTYRTQSRYPEAEPHLRKALEIRRHVLGRDHPETGQSMIAMAEWFVVSGRYAEAEPLFRDALSIFRTAHDAKWLAIALNDFGTLEWFSGNHPAAEKLLREALEVSTNFTGAERAPRAIMYSTLGLARRDQGDLTGGAAFLEKSIEEHRALPGEPRAELALAMSNLASILLLQGDYDRAESLSRDAFELFRKTVGENHQYSAYPQATLAEIYYRRGDYAKAREAIDLTMQIQQRALPPEHIDLVRSRVALGKILMRSGGLSEAESLLRPALDRLVASLPPGHATVAATRGALGECLLLEEHYAEAEPLLLESHRAFEQYLGPKDPRTKDACRRLVMLYEAWGRPEDAIRFRTS